MLNSFGSGAYRIFIESFLSAGISALTLFVHNGLGAATLFGWLGKVGGKCGLTMCVAAALANAIGIETESSKCEGNSQAGLGADSPGRRHCRKNLVQSFLNETTNCQPVNSQNSSDCRIRDILLKQFVNLFLLTCEFCF